MANRCYPIEELTGFIRAVLTSYGVLEAHAATTAERMIEADLRGMSGHGIFRLPSYARRLEEGGYNLRPDIRLVHETPVSALVDGDNGIGQVVVTHAVATALDKAEQSGIGWVGIRGSNHAGAGGVYASMALPRGLIGVYMAVGNANHMPPWGGVDLLLSTNPIAVAIPAGQEPPLVLDMATTNVSYGRVKVAAERGETMPEGWMVDRDGQPLTDPTRAGEGFLLPIGGYKGYGLNLVIGLLAGVLNDAAFGSATIDFNADYRTATNTGQLMLAVRPDLFRPLEEFTAEVDHRIREIRDSTSMEGMPPIRIPGDQAPQRETRIRSDGVPLAEGTITRLIDLAQRTGVTTHPFA
ncbi:MAG: Ldh family oxidoreductase [Nitriliruptorales bacterium]|nr:Ldh family oxidoreductase [Nitriliruptorales bacterium]